MAFCGRFFKIQCSAKMCILAGICSAQRGIPACFKAGLVNASRYSRGGKGIELCGFRNNLPVPVGL